MSNLALYDRMCSAITECVRVDEAKDIRDKALALEAYYRQARNTEAEREAANVRLRAERRVGELLKELARAETPNPEGRNQHEVTSTDGTQPQPSISEMARSRGPSPYAAALADQGMSRQQASRYQSLASIPKADFDRALSGPERPTTSGLLKAIKAPPQPKVSSDGVWLWGQLRDFENRGWFDRPLADALGGMTDAMRADVRRIAPHLQSLCITLEESL